MVKETYKIGQRVRLPTPVLSRLIRGLPHRSLQRDAQQFLRFYGKFHRQFVEHVLGITIDDQPDGIFQGYASLVTVEELVL